jgi:hypothetical protein
MLTRLTMTVLDYAVNEPTQFVKRTKDVVLYLDEHNNLVNSTNAVKTITSKIPIDQPSEDLRTLDYGTFWRDFFKNGFTEQDAETLMSAVKSKIKQDEIERVDKRKGRTDAQIKNERDELRAQLPQANETKKAKLQADIAELDALLSPFSEDDLYDPLWWKTKMNPADYRNLKPGVAEFFKERATEKRHLPQYTPSDELLKGPSTYERKGGASAGLQILQQQLKASSPGGG